jgi:hypothetical protein
MGGVGRYREVYRVWGGIMGGIGMFYKPFSPIGDYSGGCR